MRLYCLRLRSERLPLIALPIAAAGVLSPGEVCAVVRLPVVRMNHHVRIWRIVISLHRMPAGGAGLIADDGRRRAVSFNRHRSRASRRTRGRRLGKRRALQLRAQKSLLPTARRSRNLSSESSRYVGSCRANAMFRSLFRAAGAFASAHGSCACEQARRQIARNRDETRARSGVAPRAKQPPVRTATPARPLCPLWSVCAATGRAESAADRRVPRRWRRSFRRRIRSRAAAPA